jgi:hypothetical protein
VRSAKRGMLRSNAHVLTAVWAAEHNCVDDDERYR